MENIQINILDICSLEQALTELKKIDCDPAGIKLMQDKAVFKIIKIEKMKCKAANILKQTFLGKGGDVAVSGHSADLSQEYTSVLIMATVKQYKQALIQLKIQPWGLKQIGEKIENILKNANTLPKRIYSWKDRQLVLDGETSLVMGILNLTPDSFSDGGSYNELDAAIRHVEKMQADGADIIDIGAESTRPYDGGHKISAAEEMDRLLPFLQKILPHCSVPVSIDTYKAEVADAALSVGAHIINDIWGLQYDAAMPSVVAKYDVPVIVMHNKTEISYPMGVMADIEQFLSRSIAIGIEKGIKGENIIIDPGIGFAKTVADNIEIMGHLDQFKNLSCPILLGASRKKFIGHVLDLPVNERLEGTIAASALGKIKGVQIHRVHDVKAVKRTLTMMDAMIRSGI